MKFKKSTVKERKNGIKRIMRSDRLREGKHNGIIQKARWIITKSGKDAICLTLEDVKGRKASIIVVPGNMHSDRIIDTILNIYGEDDAELEDIEGIELAFELELNGDFYNLKNVYQLEEEEEDEILEDEEEEEDLLDQFEEDDYEEEDDDDEYALED